MGHTGMHVTLRYAHLAPQHPPRAIQRLCDTEVALNGPTDTRGFWEFTGRMSNPS